MSTTTTKKKDVSAAAPIAGPELTPQQQQINTAAAYLSTTSGPCRHIGDMYLTCVATAGLGMCKSYRYAYQQCVAEVSEEYGKNMLRDLADQVCGHIDAKGRKNSEEERMDCASGFVLGQMMAYAPSAND